MASSHNRKGTCAKQCGNQKEVPYMSGVDIIAETELQVTNARLSFHWAGYGLKLTFPANCLPSGVESCPFKIKASISGQYQLSGDAKLVSAVYWFKTEPNITFEKKYKVEVQNCSKPENYSKLKFYCSAATQQELRYVFQPLENGVFPSYSPYGSVQLDQCCGVAVGHEGASNKMYCTSLFYIGDSKQKLIDFVITLNLDACLTIVLEEYAVKGALVGPKEDIEFDSDHVTLGIEKGGVFMDGWQLLPIGTPTVEKNLVDHFQLGRIPRCQLKLLAIEPKMKKFLHQLILKGTKKQHIFITSELELPVTASEKLQDVIHQELLHGQPPSSGDIFSFKWINKGGEKTFKVRETFAGIWRDLGKKFGFSEGKLNTFATNNRDEPEKCFDEVISLWKSDGTVPPAAYRVTWRGLITALEEVGGVHQKVETLITALENKVENTEYDSKADGAAAREEAAEEEFFHIKYRNIVITGAGGAGKSSTMCFMLGEGPPGACSSTGICESSERAACVREVRSYTVMLQDNEYSWLGGRKLLNFFADNANARVQTRRSHTVEPSKAKEMASTTNLITSKKVSETEHSSPLSVPGLCEGDPQPSSSRTVVPLRTSIDKSLPACLIAERLMSDFKELKNDKTKSFDPTEIDLLYMVDSGGQLQFHEMINKFSKKINAIIFITDITGEPMSKVVDQFYKDGLPLGEPYESQYTHEQLFKHSLQALPLQNKKAKIAIVITHIDMVDDIDFEVTIARKNEWFFNPIESSKQLNEPFYQGTIYPGDSAKGVVFTLQSSSDSDPFRELPSDAKKLAKHLLTCLTDESVSAVEMEFPLRRFLFEQAIREAGKGKRGVVSMTECEANAQVFNIDNVKDVLQYWSNWNLLNYVREVIPDLVFCVVQTPLDVVQQLVQCCPKVHNDLEVQEIPDVGLNADNLNLRLLHVAAYGTLTEDILGEEFINQIEDVLSQGFVLNLLEHLEIIAKNGPHEYFMPCILRELPVDNFEEYRMSKTDIVEPLLLYFCEWPVASVFSTLITHLVSIYGWKLCPYGKKAKCLNRKCIKFKVNIADNCLCNICLIESYDSGYFEVHLFLPKNELPVCFKTICPVIRYKLLEALRNLNIPVQTAFFLPICSSDTCNKSKSHAALLQKSFLQCTVEKEDMKLRDTEQYYIWFNNADESVSCKYDSSEVSPLVIGGKCKPLESSHFRSSSGAAAVNSQPSTGDTYRTVLKKGRLDDTIELIHSNSERSIISKLDLSGNSNENENGLLHLCNALTTETSLVGLALSNYPLTSTKENVQAVNQMLNANKTLKLLYISPLNASSRGVLRLSECISSSSVISILDLSGSPFHNGESGLFQLCQALTTNTYLVNFKLPNCKVKENGRALSHILNTTLYVFNIPNDSVNGRGGYYLSQVISSSSAISKLDLSGNSLQDGEDGVCQGLVDDTSPNVEFNFASFVWRVSVILSGKMVQAAFKLETCMCLNSCNDIEKLTQCVFAKSPLVNTIGNGMDYLSSCITSTISKLDLSDNSIQDGKDACEVFASLVGISLGNCKLNVACDPVLCHMLMTNTTLASSTLSTKLAHDAAVTTEDPKSYDDLKCFNFCCDKGNESFVGHLSLTKALKELYLSCTSISPEAVHNLSTLLEHNSTLKKLNVSHEGENSDIHDSTEKTIMVLSESLNKTLKRLNGSHCKLTTETVNMLSFQYTLGACMMDLQNCLNLISIFYFFELVNLFRLFTSLRMLLIMAGDVERNPGPTNVKPTIEELRVLPFADFSEIYHRFGMELGFKLHELAEIERSQKNWQKRKFELFRRWLKREKAASWNTVLIALKKIGEAETAKTICSVYDLTEKHLELISVDSPVHEVPVSTLPKGFAKAKTSQIARAKETIQPLVQSQHQSSPHEEVTRSGSSADSWHSAFDEESTPSYESESSSQSFRRQTAPVISSRNSQLGGNGTKQFSYNQEWKLPLESSQAKSQSSHSPKQKFGASQLESGQLGKSDEPSQLRGSKPLLGKFLDAVKSDDPVEVQKLITQQGVNVDQVLLDGNTALLLASVENKKEVAKVLLQLNASVKATDREGCSPLYKAASNGNYEIVKLLMQHNAVIDVRTKDGTPLLLPPSMRGFSIITEYLLENGCDPNQKDKGGMTPLIGATIKRQKDVVKVLLEHGADVSVVCLETSKTALQEAIELEHTELVTILIKATSVASAKNRELFTCKTAEGIRKLAKSGAKVDERRGDGTTPLMTHAASGNHDVVGELLRLRANVDLQDHAGASALMKSAAAGHVEIVQSLIVAGAVLDLKSKEGQTALMLATRSNHTRVVKELLQAGANPHLKNMDGQSAAEVATVLDYEDISVLFDKLKTVGTKDDPFVSLLNSYLHLKETPETASAPILPRRMPDGDDLIIAQQPTTADDSALKTELTKSYKRIADLETRINDLTLQTTLEITDESDLSYLDRTRLETEFRKQKDLKRKAETYAVEAKQTAQRLSAENYKLREDLSRERHYNELTRKNMLREMEQKMDKRANTNDRVDAKLEVFNQEVSVKALGLIKRNPQAAKPTEIGFEFVKEFVMKERVRVNLIQLGFAGLPYSGRSTLVSQVLELSSSLDQHAIKSTGSVTLDLNHFECVVLRHTISGKCVWKPSTKYYDRDIGFAWALAQSLTRSNHQPNLAEDLPQETLIFPDARIDAFFKESYKNLRQLFGRIQADGKELEFLTASSLTFANCLDIGVNRTAFEILPLLAGKCKNVILMNVLNLMRDARQLNKPPNLSDDMYHGRYTANQDSETLLKLLPSLDYYFRPILVTNVSLPVRQSTPANTILVGTHADKLIPQHLTEAKKIVESSVQSLANQYKLSGAICPGVVAVDLTKESDYLKVRSEVEKMLETNAQNFEVDLPLSWLFLRVILYSIGKVFVSMDYIKEIAKNCGIEDENDVKKFLEVYKNCGSLFTVGPIVVLNVLKFFDDLNKLYYIHQNQSQHPVPRQFKEDVANLNFGFLSKRLANHLWSEKDESGRLTAKFHINLLKGLEVLLPIDDVPLSDRKDKHYFMPSLRPDFSTKSLNSNSNSLYVTFNSGLVSCHMQTQFVRHFRDSLPQNLKGKLTLQRNSVYNKTLFKWEPDVADHSRSDKPVYVEIVFVHNFLEVNVEVPEGQILPTKLYAVLKSACVSIFHKMKRDMIPTLNYNLAIVSPGCANTSRRDAHPHLLTFNPANPIKSLVCKDCEKKFSVSEIPSERRLWIQTEYLGPPSKLQDVLDDGDIHKISATLSSLSAEKLQAFAKQLEVSDADLSSIAAHASVEDVIFHLLYEWKQQHASSASLELLSEALMKSSCYNEALVLHPGAIAQPSPLPKQVSLREMICIANHLNETLWKQLGAVLGAPMKEGGGGHKSVPARERCLRMLKEWQEKDDSPRKALVYGLESLQHWSLADAIKTGAWEGSRFV